MENNNGKNSFFYKTKLTCPACGNKFQKEVMRSGQGRLISLKMRRDLRRVYKYSTKYGEMYPLIYNAVVCPKCYFATLSEDFNLKNGYDIPKIKDNYSARVKALKQFGFGMPNYTKPRSIKSGMIALFLAANCYSFCTYPVYRQAKQGLAALRASWCCDDLASADPTKRYEQLAVHFRYFAYQNYVEAQDKMYKPKSKFGEITNFGPDLDTNYGYSGFIYIYSYLTMYFFELSKTKSEAYKKMKKVQIFLSKIFGFGQSSKEKPGPLLEKAREFYEEVREIMNKLQKKMSVAEIEAIEEDQEILEIEIRDGEVQKTS